MNFILQIFGPFLIYKLKKRIMKLAVYALTFALVMASCGTSVSQNTGNNTVAEFNKKIIPENELLSFGLLKQDNAEWLLDDYNADIKRDTIRIFIPYLAHFSLKPQFSIGKKAKVKERI